MHDSIGSMYIFLIAILNYYKLQWQYCRINMVDGAVCKRRRAKQGYLRRWSMYDVRLLD